MKILVLGHKGMLGNAVYQYFNDKADVVITDNRWDINGFKIKADFNVDVIINCIGAIPQKGYTKEEFDSLNSHLPTFLETKATYSTRDIKIIYPASDCEFSGNLPFPYKYTNNSKRDAEDDYGKSKVVASVLIESAFKYTKAIRTSIIGHELSDKKFSLLDWFLSQEGEVNGYINHWWSGITSLQWCKVAEDMINNWDKYNKITQVATDPYSKYIILLIIKKAYQKDIKINEYIHKNKVNRMLCTDISVPDIYSQLMELKQFYGK
jgi:dTDP-4-dehydrorhamnose reductase